LAAATSLFALPGALQDFLGVAYDPNNNSLWISGYQKDVIADYSLDGTLLSSFTTGQLYLTALAFDPADSTLWFNIGGNTLYQYSTSGELLQSGMPIGLPSGRGDAGEFAEPISSVPLPSALPLFASGLAGLGRLSRRKKGKHVA
jgi:hypothetical protein